MFTSAATSSRPVALAATLLLGGCSLLTQGTSQEVTFTSEPPGASLTVAGRTIVTPATVDLPKNDQSVVFTMAGYRELPVELKLKTCVWFYASLLMGPLSTMTDVVSGAWKEFETDRVHVVLEPLPDTVTEMTVVVTSEPSGADVEVDGAARGTTPVELKLGWRPTDREKLVLVKRAGWNAKTTPLRRDERAVHAVLEPQPIPVRVHFGSVPEGAEVFIDGVSLGTTPLDRVIEWLPGAAPKYVGLRKEGYRVEKCALQREQTDVRVELTEVVEERILPLNVQPAGALVEVDGVAIGEAGSEIRLRWSVTHGRHTVKVSHPGCRSQTVVVQRDSGGAPLEVRLLPMLGTER